MDRSKQLSYIAHLIVMHLRLLNSSLSDETRARKDYKEMTESTRFLTYFILLVPLIVLAPVMNTLAHN